MLVQKIIATWLQQLTALVFPAVLVAIAASALVWQLVHVESQEQAPVPIRVWEQTAADPALPHTEALRHLDASAPTRAFESRLSTHDFWLTLEMPASDADHPLVVDFPSRHATNLTCWDRASDRLLGSADRRNTSGGLSRSRAGFALALPGLQHATPILCRGAFRGPAKISAQVWSGEALDAAQAAHQKKGSMIEAGIGVLALFMLLTALVNHSRLYWTFVGWLLLNMRMAALSAGTDFDLFGLAIDPAAMIAVRQWTVCVYYAMTIGLFSLLFQAELKNIRAGWPLTLHQLSALALIAAPLFLSFENTLPALWLATTSVVALMVYYLWRILLRTHSRVAGWYAASIVVTLVASLNEVVAAATGQRNLLIGLNSVTAAIASALLASAAIAEHMRSDRLQKIAAQKTLQAAYDDSPIGLFTVGDGGLIAKTNPAFQTKLQGMAPPKPTHLTQLFDDRVVRAITALQTSRSQSSIELQTKIRHPGTGSDRWFAIKASTTDGSIIEGTLQDITEQVLATERLEFLANHDPLTECMNLRGIARRLGRQERLPTALVYFDLDRFKLINDLYGHAAGDNVLKQVCERMQRPLEPGDLLARVGGDEFVIAFARATMSQAAERCAAIMDLISSQPYQIDSQSFALSVSGGLVGTEHFVQAPLKEIISAADTLCRMAKKRTTERLVVMESGDQFLRHHKDELDLIASLERGETPEGLFLVMQPEICLSRPFESLNFEVLLRLRKPDGQVVPANVIIEAAEAHGKTAIIDRWVVTTAITWLETHAAALRNTRFVGINLSGGSLNDETFTEELFALFAQHPAALSMVCIEITETVALTDMRNMQRFIDRIHSIGAKVGLDDFGAGYSSFGYLKDLAVDALKLDGSLVKGAARNPASMAIIVAIAGLVNSLGMKSIGEFAEDLPTIKVLVEAGVNYAQGYGISMPVLPERILAATSVADLIEDPEVLAYIRQLQAPPDDAAPAQDVPGEHTVL